MDTPAASLLVSPRASGLVHKVLPENVIFSKVRVSRNTGIITPTTFCRLVLPVHFTRCERIAYHRKWNQRGHGGRFVRHCDRPRIAQKRKAMSGAESHSASRPLQRPIRANETAHPSQELDVESGGASPPDWIPLEAAAAGHDTQPPTPMLAVNGDSIERRTVAALPL